MEIDRWSYISNLDEELLRGGVIISEWCSYVVQETDRVFAEGAYLATIVLAVSAIETHLKGEKNLKTRSRLVDLIDSSGLPEGLRVELHALRKYRNRWVHVEDQWDDDKLAVDVENVEQELEGYAFLSVRILRKTLYTNPWI